MKLSFPIAILIFHLVIATSTSYAQSPNLKNGIAVRGMAIDYFSPNEGDAARFLEDYTEGAEFSYIRNLNRFLNLEIPIKLGSARLPLRADEQVAHKQMIYGLDARLQIQYFKENHFIVPYLFGGFGFLGNEENEIGLQIPVGLGLNFKLAPKVYLQLQSERRLALDSNDPDSYMHKVGFLFLHGQSGEALPKEPLVPDRDGDGVSDLEDRCPNEAGLTALAGCPDGDGDGVADKDDVCPEKKGLPSFSGCPDTDGDGLSDPQDDCPEVAGLIENKGCPAADRDGDGVADSQDECPDAAGSVEMKGCPDRDNDRISDRLDDCPDVPGLARYGGCPDTDGDGVPDPTDNCPEVMGPAASNGCPTLQEEEREVLDLAMQAVQFEQAKAALKTNSYSILDQIVAILKKYTAYSMSIEGHTDSIGTYDNNQRLSEKRAKACHDYLVLKGISPSRLNYVGYGESRPIANNKYKEGRSENRRVEFKLYLK